MNSENPDAHEPHYTPNSESRPPRAQQSNPLELLKPRGGYLITPILIWLNVGVFLLMVISGVNALEPSGEDLVKWGANYSPLTTGGQPWRLLTCCFLHIGIIHLVFNMYALMQIGPILEPLLGSRQFTIAYLTAGLMGSVVSVWWHDVVNGAGASGAIFGMYGVFLALLTTNWLEATVRKALLQSILIFVGFNLFVGMQAHIDNAAHIGGLLAGLFTGYAYYLFVLRSNQPANRALLPMIVPPVLAIVLAVLVYTYKSNPLADFDRLMGRFNKLNGQAMSVFQLPKTTPAAGVAKAINDQGVVAWEEAINLLDEADKLDLPDGYHQHTKLLRQYTMLRLKSFNLLQRSLADTTHIYDKQIGLYDQQIAAVLEQLSAKKK
ncbi:rhomboid family intramembrane serine protease [Spirosoma foliorum]|uniref:Rhomboid family intramembrane serine protease n=1 Tax=Spirosoma foliorum TaxID=2710596 RepID=A0A7G5GSA3_9BACT|nr:rhomboid family intramembrane serine protease [Spirosoma foliorum]QMW01745.1 rhomboid family intramembrane serine protease [Spirosoma foliorum]